jgi:hypothetical protein
MDMDQTVSANHSAIMIVQRESSERGSTPTNPPWMSTSSWSYSWNRHCSRIHSPRWSVKTQLLRFMSVCSTAVGESISPGQLIIKSECFLERKLTFSKLSEKTTTLPRYATLVSVSRFVPLKNEFHKRWTRVMVPRRNWS